MPTHWSVEAHTHPPFHRLLLPTVLDNQTNPVYLVVHPVSNVHRALLISEAAKTVQLVNAEVSLVDRAIRILQFALAVHEPVLVEPFVAVPVGPAGYPEPILLIVQPLALVGCLIKVEVFTLTTLTIV